MNYKTRFDPDSITDEDLLFELKKLADLLGRTPSQDDIRKFGNATTKRMYLYRRRFGSLQAAQEKIGCNKNPSGFQLKYSDKELLDEILSIQKLLGKTPTQEDIGKYSKYAIGAFKRHFGTYNAALQKLGLRHNVKFGQNEEEIKDDVIRIAKLLGRAPTRLEFWEYSSTVSCATAIDKIDGYQSSWNEVLKACNIDVVNNRNLTEMELKSEVFRLQSELKRIPGYYDMIQFGKYSPETYALRFGTYVLALKHFGLEYEAQNHWFNQTRTMGADGTSYRSKFEAMIAGILLSFKNKKLILGYEYEKRVCSERNWTCDFLITTASKAIWLEADGMGKNRPEIYDDENEKIKYYLSHAVPFYILSYSKNKGIYAELFSLIGASDED